MALRNSYVSVKVDCRTTPSAALARISLFVVSALLVGACATVPSDQARGATVAAGQSGTRAVSGTTGSEFTSQPSPATTEMTSHPLATTTQPAPNTVPRASTSSTGSVSQSVGTGRVLRVTGRHLFTFTSPSGNIVCLMQESETQSNDASVRCSIESKTWKPPPRPSSCGLDWGSDLELDHGGDAGFLCYGDTIRQATPGEGQFVVLGYGDSVEMESISCVSQTDGTRCLNHHTRHGFFISRSRYSLF